MADRPTVLAAKVDKLAEIIMDANDRKAELTDLDTVRSKMRDAAREVMDAEASVAAIENIPLPSERG